MVQLAPRGTRAGKTRAAILEAAEAVFAERGFDAARLEDIAERVGIRRASIVYHFRDKRELYEAVLDSVFGGLHQALAEVLGGPEPLPERIEAGVSVWVDYVGRRPTLASFILREVADASSEGGAGLRSQTQPFAELIRKEVYERPDFEDAQFAEIDPVHVASIVSGATVFFVAAMPALLPGGSFDPTSEDQLATLKDELLRILRRLTTR